MGRVCDWLVVHKSTRKMQATPLTEAKVDLQMLSSRAEEGGLHL